MTIQKAPLSMSEPIINNNAEIVLRKRYYKTNKEDSFTETARDLFWRVAKTVAEEELKYPSSPYTVEELTHIFYTMMVEWKFLPNSPTLMNAGMKLGQLSACFVLPIGDSIEEIFDAVKYSALIHKSGGGTGFSFSSIRPKDSMVGSTGGVASGPLSFIRIFNTATEQIKQGGTRRGANMGILRIDHPDILEFIRAKEKDGEFNNFNFSIALTEEFMEAVELGKDYPLRNPQTNEICAYHSASEVFGLLVEKAWKSGDPGIVFIDRINKDNPTPAQGDMESTNPCGEQPLLPYEACNLGSINLVKFYDSKTNSVDWSELRTMVHLSIRFLDNVIDANQYPLPQITEIVGKNRKIGLGVMGFADLLYCCGIPYNSQEGVDIAEQIMAFIHKESKEASHLLAQERGAFPAWQDSIFAEDRPYRNATVNTIAPTGTLSIIAGCSSGVEPLFALCFSRHVMETERLVESNIYFENALKEAGIYSKVLLEKVAETGGISSLPEIPEHIKRIYVTAMEIEPEWHLRMQAAFQRHTDNAVSKTVNLPNNATIEDIYTIYWLAYKEGCKGVTVYRDGCKSFQVLNTGNTSGVQTTVAGKEHNTHIPEPRPDVLTGFTQKVQTGLGVLYLTINERDGRPFELFATIGKSGRSVTAKAEAIGRLVSLALRSGIAIREIVNQLKDIGGEHPIFQKKGLLLSIPDAVAWVLETRYLQPGETTTVCSIDKPRCSECGELLIFQEGCYKCSSCGFSKCG